MYIEHPFKYNGVYYAKIDGELIEITREQAKVMLSFYRNSKNYDKRWGYKGDTEESENSSLKKREQDEIDNCRELMEELEQEEKESERKAMEEEEDQEKKYKESDGKKKKESQLPKRKMIVPREILLDCVFSENAFDLSVQDMPGENPQSTETVVMKKFEYQELYDKISRLSAQDQHLIEEVFFKGTPQVDVAKELGITPQSVYSRLKYCLNRLRRLYVFG